MAEETTVKKWNKDIKQIGDKIVGLTLMQAKELGDYLKDEHRLISMTLPWQAVGVELCDMYNLPIERISTIAPETIQCEIIEIEKRIMEGEIDVVGREVI